MENPRLGMRVRVNETMPYGYHGREGTIVKLPTPGGVGVLKDWIGVAFDGNDSGFIAEWHQNYFDLIEPQTVSC